MLRGKPAVVGLLAFSAWALVSAVRAEDDVKTIIQKTRQGTALVVTKSGSGTAWLVDRANRLLVTNQHVVEDYPTVLIWFPIYKDGKVVTEKKAYREELGLRGQVLDTDVKRDLAVIQLRDRLPDEVQELKLAADSTESGERLHSIGNPGAADGALWVYTSGRVRAVYEKEWPNLDMNKQQVSWRNAKIVLADSPVNPGDSGGPVVNDKGEIVAVVSHGKTMDKGRLVQAMNGHIDVSEVRAFVEQTRNHLNPKTAGDFTERAKRRIEQRNFSDAIDDLSMAIKLDKTNAQAFERRAWCFFRRADYDTCIADCSKAIQLNGEDAQAYYTRGWARDRSKQYDLALEDYTRAIQIDPKMARAYNNRGVIYHDHKNDLSRALTDYSRAIELDARNDIARSNRSHIHYEYRDYGKAFADADAALDINPFNSSAWNVRGWVLQQKDPAMAVNNYNQALEFVPNNAVLFANRGRALSKVKDGLAKAVDDYSKAIELDRNYHWAYLYRGQAYEAVNSLNGQNDYKRALELHPKHDATIKKFQTMHLRIINDASEPIRVYAQYEYMAKDGSWVWHPPDPTKTFWSFKPGEAAFLLDGDWKLKIRRARLWAVGENSGGSNTTYRNNPLWLAPEAGYLATSHMTYTYRFGGKE